VKARAPAGADDAAAGAGPEAETSLTGTGTGVEPPGLVGPVGLLDPVGVLTLGHEALAVPLSAPSIPQTVTGIVTPEPPPPPVPMGVPVLPLPVQTVVAFPSMAAATEQTVTGAVTGSVPVWAALTWLGSHEFEPVPSTATTTLHALTGKTPSMGADWVSELVGTPSTSGVSLAGMHLPAA
jgi:hypothetical protein